MFHSPDRKENAPGCNSRLAGTDSKIRLNHDKVRKAPSVQSREFVLTAANAANINKTMITTDPINYLIAAFAASLPLIYIIIAARIAMRDLESSEELSRLPGQTNHTAILDLHSEDGHGAPRERNNLHEVGHLTHAMAQG